MRGFGGLPADEAAVGLLAESGCRQVLIDLEIPRRESLRDMDPAGFKAQQAESYVEAIDRLQTRGITVNGCFILGLEDHTPRSATGRSTWPWTSSRRGCAGCFRELYDERAGAQRQRQYVDIAKQRL